jgi:hypothetical protein
MVDVIGLLPEKTIVEMMSAPADMPGVARQPLTFFASPKKVSKERRAREAALRVRIKIGVKAGNETNSPAAQTGFISYPL